MYIPVLCLVTQLYPSLCNPMDYSYKESDTIEHEHTYLYILQSLSCLQLFLTPWTVAHQVFLGKNTGVE